MGLIKQSCTFILEGAVCAIKSYLKNGNSRCGEDDQYFLQMEN